VLVAADLAVELLLRQDPRPARRLDPLLVGLDRPHRVADLDQHLVLEVAHLEQERRFSSSALWSAPRADLLQAYSNDSSTDQL
jgi:hypothetical protein